MSSNRTPGAALSVALVGAAALSVAAYAAEDLSQLHVAPQRGQSADQARRDRYECHNWAVEQTGQTPAAAPAPQGDEPTRDESEKRELASRIFNGAAIGAGLGGLVRATQNEDPANGILAGAAVGAAVGAATGHAKARREEAKAAAAGPSDYLRALTACMEGRGYTVALPMAGEVVAHR